MEKIAVAMSVYYSDKLCLLKECIDSLIGQTYKNMHVYIMIDGPVEKEVELYLTKLSNDENFNVEFCKENCGLATRLNQIIDKDMLHTRKIDYDKLIYKNIIPNSSVILKKELLVELKFNEDFRYKAIEDYHMWLRILQNEAICEKLDFQLLFYRMSLPFHLQ